MKLTASMMVTLDGVYQGPGGPDEDRRGGFDRGGWTAAHADPEMWTFLTDMFSRADALLLGRKTWEIWEPYWPLHDGGDAVSHGINVLPKYVPSTTLKDPTWQNTRVIDGDVEAAIRVLKAQRLGRPRPIRTPPHYRVYRVLPWARRQRTRVSLRVLQRAGLQSAARLRIRASRPSRVPRAQQLVQQLRARTDPRVLVWQAGLPIQSQLEPHLRTTTCSARSGTATTQTLGGFRAGWRVTRGHLPVGQRFPRFMVPPQPLAGTTTGTTSSIKTATSS